MAEIWGADTWTLAAGAPAPGPPISASEIWIQWAVDRAPGGPDLGLTRGVSLLDNGPVVGKQTRVCRPGLSGGLWTGPSDGACQAGADVPEGRR